MNPVDEATAAKRRMIYETALNSKDPTVLRAISAAFRKEGCYIEADMLDKRVALCEMPEELRLARRDAFRKTMRCTDPQQVRSMAVLFEGYGATGAAADLNRYAAGLEAAQMSSQVRDAEGMTHDDS